MNIVIKPLSEIKPYSKNPRKNDDAVEYVMNSIKEFGIKQPIVIDAGGTIVAGHTRYKAAKQLKLKEFPCVIADDLTEAQIQAYRLADNKVTEIAEWDFGLLDLELDGLCDVFDMADFGFDFDNFEKIGVNKSKELNKNDYMNDNFEHECPSCGFRFNE